MKVTPDTMAAEIQKVLEKYGDDIRGSLDEATKETAKIGVQALKNKSNETFNDVKMSKGRYGSGWTSTLEATRTGAKAILYNKKYPGLPHLLENGHAKRGGGRVQGQPHIAPVEEQLEKEFVEEVTKLL